MAHDLPDPLAWAVAEFRDAGRAQNYAKYSRYLQGDQDLAFASAKFEQAFGSTFREFAYNRMQSVVDAHTDRLRIDGFQADNEAVAAHAQKIWDRNEMVTRLNEFVAQGLAMGDGSLMVWPNDAPGGDALATIWPQKPYQMRFHYSDERPGQLTTAARAWKDHGEGRDGKLRLTIYTDGLIQRYITRNKVHGSMPNSVTAFEPFNDGTDPEFTHPFGIPVVHYANNGWTGEYGQSELRDVVNLQDSINKVLMDGHVAEELIAFPLRVLLGVTQNDPDLIQQAERFITGMTRMLALGDNTSIAEFSAADLGNFNTMAEGYDTRISRNSRVPVHYLQMTGGFESGRALRIAEAPFVSKIEDRQAAIGARLREAMALALRMEGVTAAPGLQVVWRSAAPLSDEDKWDIAIQKRTAGMPFVQVLIEMGYEQDKVDEIMAMKAEEGMTLERAFDAGRFAGDEPDVAV